MSVSTRFEIDGHPIQHISSPTGRSGFEGVAFSPSGTMAIAAAYANEVRLYRPKQDGKFEEEPFWCMGKGQLTLDFPHDVAFSTGSGKEFLAIAERRGVITIYEKNDADGGFGSEPVFTIGGPQSQLSFTDGVAFVPPDDGYLAACNAETGTITFYRRTSLEPLRFETVPEFVLKDATTLRPDGIGFSACGTWLVSANHSSHCYSIFKRRSRMLSGGKLKYGPRPAAVVDDPELRHPHSAVFTPGACNLLGTNAGANFFGAYELRKGLFGTKWSKWPMTRITTNTEEAFRAVNSQISQEGGPKGIAACKDRIAVCSPEFGVKIYAFRERPH